MIGRNSGWLLVSAAWLLGSFGSGAIAAWLYKRLYPALSFHKLWAFWTVIFSLSAALLFALGWV